MDKYATMHEPGDSMRRHNFWCATGTGMLVALVIFIAALAGIWSRPAGHVALLWPANSIMLGIMTRWPRLSDKPSWLGALAGFLLADLLMGSNLLMTFWMTLANMAGVFTGWIMLQRLEPEEQNLKDPASMRRLLGVCAAAAAASALIGGGITTLMYGQSTFTGLSFWFAGELAQYILILPIFLTWPGAAQIRALLLQPRSAAPSPEMLLPALALAFSLLAMLYMDGPGTTYFPIPALLWCALVYPLFPMAILTLGWGLWALWLYAERSMHPELASLFLPESISIRLGLALLALAPLSVAAFNSARNRTLAELEYTVTHDPLTGALRRRIFVNLMAEAHARAASSRDCMAMLRIGIDDFRFLLDRYGYWTADAVLAAIGRETERTLRGHGLFGRLGDEEFGVLLDSAGAREPEAQAERLRQAVETLRIPLDDGAIFDQQITVTIGLAQVEDASRITLDELQAGTDHALFQGRQAGGNQVVRKAV